MRPVLACTHSASSANDLLTRALVEHGLVVVEANLERGDPLPPLAGLAAIISFGGQMSVLDIERFPFLLAERDLLARAVAEGVPVLGICLGSQLLASAAGGSVIRLPERFVDFPVLVRLPAALDDAVFDRLPPELQVVEWHEDAVIAPPESVALAETRCPGRSIYRVGACAWGTQIHLEFDRSVLGSLLQEPSEIEQLVEAGVDPAWFAATASEVLVEQAERSAPVLDRFAAFVAAREQARSAAPAEP